MGGGVEERTVENHHLDVDGFKMNDSHGAHDAAFDAKGTVWDLVPLKAKRSMYPHQREGFEVMWKNVAGDLSIEKAIEPLSVGEGGCIMSHSPGTGKTRLTIVFLQTFMKLFPTCHPVIIAPLSMLYTWQAEFRKWEADVPFHCLNMPEFSGQEDLEAMNLLNRLENGNRDKSGSRMVKLLSWHNSTSVLAISYCLFEKLTGESRKEAHAEQIREILLTYPGLLILDEGHTPRNEQSLMWKALRMVEAKKRIVLSGTPFQNNFKELFNTLSLVNASFADRIEQQWNSITSVIDKQKHFEESEELRTLIAPLVHVHKGEVLQSLPGVRDTVVYLKPTDLQTDLISKLPKNLGFFLEQNLVSLISVHPSLVANRGEFSLMESKLRALQSDPNFGVKMKFVLELIRLSDGMKERVIIFSQLIDPLTMIKEQLISLFRWTLGQEILYMDGKVESRQRQAAINSLNDPNSDVKVLLASTRACSEGINLIGASRVVLLDVFWNPSVERQAISRAFRIGQKKIVRVYHLVGSKMEVNTIERQMKKDRLSDLVFVSNEVMKNADSSCSVAGDEILDAMVRHESLRNIFERLAHQPKNTLV